MRYAGLSVLVLLVGCETPSLAKSIPLTQYSLAEAYFNNSIDRARVINQVLLIATGHMDSVPTDRFTSRTFAAISRFQSDNGLYPSGRIDSDTQIKLSRQGRNLLDLWDFRVVPHPTMRKEIWMPQGLGLLPHPNNNGVSLQDPQKRAFVDYNYFPGASVQTSFNRMRVKMKIDGAIVDYAVMKDGWYALSATSADGNEQYMRYHRYNGGILGFALFWNRNNTSIPGERIATLMSASLGSALNGRPMVEPPGNVKARTTDDSEVPAAQPDNVELPPRPASFPAIVTSPAAPLPSISPQAEEKRVSTGTGFFVDAKASFVTNAHVVKSCKTVTVKLNDGKDVHKARVVATDFTNDLALLSITNVSNNKFAPVRIGGRLGEGIATFGYPHADVLATSGNFTVGNITAVAGLGDDSRFFQVSAPVQSGNSGGPMLDNYGNALESSQPN